MYQKPLCALAIVLSSTWVTACSSDSPKTDTPSAEEDRLFVAHAGMLAAYELKNGDEIPGTIPNVDGPTDMQALENGDLLVNLTNRNEILAIDGRTMLESARIPSSSLGGLRPVHSYLTPERGGKQYWVALNDGTEGEAATNSALFIDVTGGGSYLTAAGEIGLGIGHHKATFSATTERVVISNISDCERVLTVFDYSDIGDIQELANATAEDLGWDGSDFATTCDPTYQMGLPPAPHGCATSKASGKAYCNLTGSGAIVSIDVDASPPTFHSIPTTGSGGGYTKAHPAGRYIYSLEGEPREGSGGVDCQIGQLVVIDGESDEIINEVPLLYKGPDCSDSIVGTDEETAEPAHSLITDDDKTLFITTAGGFEVADARVRQELVVDISDPAEPVQLPSIEVGTSTGYHGDSLSGDGKWLFVADNLDGTVSQIDASTFAVWKTIFVEESPQTLATFGSAGPSHQTGPIH